MRLAGRPKGGNSLFLREGRAKGRTILRVGAWRGEVQIAIDWLDLVQLIAAYKRGVPADRQFTAHRHLPALATAPKAQDVFSSHSPVRIPHYHIHASTLSVQYALPPVRISPLSLSPLSIRVRITALPVNTHQPYSGGALLGTDRQRVL